MRNLARLCAVALLTGPTIAAPADEWTHVASAHIASGRDLWDSPIGRPIHERIDGEPEIAALRAGFGFVAGVPLERAADAILGGAIDVEVHTVRSAATRLAPDGGRPRPHVLVRAHTAEADDTRRLFDAGLAFVREQAWVREETYRDVDYARVGGDAVAAVVGDVLLVASHDDLLADAIDRLLDETETPTPPDEGVVVTLDPTALPRRDGAPQIDEQPLADLLLAGLVDVTAGARAVAAHLTWTDGALQLDTRVDGDTPLAGSPYAPPTEEALRVPVSAETLAVFSARRDVAEWWRRRETLLSPSVQKQLAKFDSDMTTLFAGQDFAEDVLARLDDAWALVVDRQRFADAEHVPDVELPGICLVARVRDGEEEALTGTMRVAFQSVVAFVNADRAERGRAPFLLDVERVDGHRVHAATLQPALGRTGTSDGAIEFNAAPSMALVDDWLLLGSSAEQVARLVSAIVDDELTSVAANTAFELDVTRGLDLAIENRAALVAQTVLDEGLDATAAARQVDELFDLVGLFERVEIDVVPSPHGFEVAMTVETAER